MQLQALTHKGYPAWAPPLAATAVGKQGWNIHQPDWPMPCAVLRQGPLVHNLGWLQRLVSAAGAQLAPHGKTTLSPELMQAQLNAGAWGITFANVAQLALGVAHGVRCAILANQVWLPHDLNWLLQLQSQHPDLRAPFLLDSHAQLDALEAVWRQHAAGTTRRFDVLLELGLEGGRTGCRDDAHALALAERIANSPATQLVGVECYEGLWAQGDDAADRNLVDGLMARVQTVLKACDRADAFQRTDAILITAGGSAVFDLVLAWLGKLSTPTGQASNLTKPVVGVLRSGCYITHDHGAYQRLVHQVTHRLSALPPGHPMGHAATGVCGSGLQAALEVWCSVQSLPEPGLAILNAGKRDLSHDWGLPVPLAVVPAGTRQTHGLPAQARITRLNDQHAYLEWDTNSHPVTPLAVGDQVGLGISHPCTTFDRWRWMPVVDDHGGIVDAITTGF